jgi:hypothetical protein
MKKIIILIISVFILTQANAQHNRGQIKWLSLAVKGGYGGAILMNKDVINDENISLNYLSPHYSFGGRFGITYGDNIGINVEPLWSGIHQQYSIKDNVQPYIKTQKFKTFDLFVSLRFITNYGLYVEAGPQFTTLKSAEVENDKEASFTENQNGTYLENFTKKNTSLGFGVGFAAINGDRLQLFVGLRANYGFGNFVNNPAYYVLNDGVYQPQYNFSAKTSPITYKLMLELNYFFGFWGDATCGKGRLIFFQ